tara:strand:+ start:3227 stop:3496 length:270 start_codon:yes stop_codon:yes gene_type:complete
MIQIGDFVAQICSDNATISKKGIVIESLKDSYTVQWLTYNKKFWMDLEHPIFEELNRTYLLTKMSIHRKNSEVDIRILSKAGKNGLGNP